MPWPKACPAVPVGILLRGVAWCNQTHRSGMMTCVPLREGILSTLSLQGALIIFGTSNPRHTVKTEIEQAGNCRHSGIV